MTTRFATPAGAEHSTHANPLPPSTFRARPARAGATSAGLRWGVVLAALLLTAGTGFAGGIPEPDTVLYGKVFNFNAGHEILVTEGDMEWTIRLDEDSGRRLVMKTRLEPIANGQYSYRLRVPHEAAAAGILASDLSPGSVALTAGATRYRHVEVRVNGVVARILPPAPEVFEVSQARRSAAHRLDLDVLLGNPDTDGDGLPDWWEQRFGLDKFVRDATGDLDGDGLSNLREFQLGSDPTASNVAPSIAWENTALDEGSTEVLTIQAVDADTPPDALVYTLIEEPVGARFRVLFGATVSGPDGRLGDRELHAGDTWTQAQVDAGELVVTHEDPEADTIDFRVRLTDGDAAHAPFESTLTLHVHQPSAVDGTGAALWLDARAAARGAAGNLLSTWPDRSGPKPWFAGDPATFDALAGGPPVRLIAQGPLGQSVAAFNLPGVPLGPDAAGNLSSQFLTLPAPEQARVFNQGDLTVFAVFKSLAIGSERQQIVSGTHFQFGLTGAQNHGRDSQVRFSSDQGAVYGNREIPREWVLATAWQQQEAMSVELNGLWSGGPHPLDEPTPFGTDPLVAGRAGVTFDAVQHQDVRQVDQAFQGYLAELLVFNRAVDDIERKRINCALLSKWFGWVLCDGVEESRDLDWRVASSGMSAEAYRTNFVPVHGPDRHYILLGGAGNDRLQGGMNDDLLVGEGGVDRLTGGGGRDVFVFNHGDQDAGRDTVTDFRPREDLDALDLANVLRGASRHLRDYLHLRTDGHHSYLEVDFEGERAYTDHTIELLNVVLRDSDLYDLWARGNLITGDKRFPLPVSLVATQPIGTEITGEPAVFTLHFDGQSVPDGLEIPFELDGSAVRDVDYRLSVRTYDQATGAYGWETVPGHELFVREKVGDLDFAIRVEPIADGRAEGPETVRLQLTPVPEWFDLAVSTATVTIQDGTPRVSITASEPQASEGGGEGAFTLRRVGSLDVPLDVRVRLTGPAQNGVDYAFIGSTLHFDAGQAEIVVTLAPHPDEIREFAEAAELVVEPGEGYVVDPQSPAAIVSIEDAGAVVTVEAIEPLAVVGDGIPGAFLVRRRGVLSENLTVRLEISGTAAAGIDYRRLTRFLTLTPGSSTALLMVEPLGSAVLDQPVETIGVAVVPDASYAVGAPGAAEVRLIETALTFAGWKAARFPGEPMSPAAFAAVDSDGDGWSNAAEYALGLDPRVPEPTTTGVPWVGFENGRLTVRLRHPVAVGDVDYLLETSADLAVWQPAATHFDQTRTLTAADGFEAITLHEKAGGSGSQRYVRVQVRLR